MGLGDCEIRRVAERMLADYDAHRPNEVFAGRGTNWLTIEDAYALQRAVSALRQARGEKRIGYKVGCVSATIQHQLGLDQPVYGCLWDAEAFVSGCHLSSAQFDHLAIEGEVALRLGRDLPANLPNHAEDLAVFIECWFPVVELHNHVFRGGKPTSQELVAGNAMHAGFVAPSEIGNRNLAVLDQAEVRIEVDGVVVERNRAASLPGGPLGSVRWLASTLARRGKTVKAGDVVLTGSPGRLIPLSGGAVVVSSEGMKAHCHCVAKRAGEVC